MKRFNLYREIHKGIRSLLSDVVYEAGRADFNSSSEVAALRGSVTAALDMMTSHAEHENAFIEPVIAKAAPEVAKELTGAHEEQEGVIARLRAALASIDPNSSNAAVEGHQFVVDFSRFTGELLVHMADEEQKAMPALWAKFDDAYLIDLHGRLVGSIAPEEMAAVMRMMLPAMNTPERVETLAGIRAHAPAPVFAFIRGIARESLSDQEFAILEARLETAA